MPTLFVARFPTHTQHDTNRLSDSQFEQRVAECIAAQPVAGEHGPWERKLNKFCFSPIPSLDEGFIWDEDTRARLTSIAEQCEAAYNVRLTWSNDGCPYIGHGTTMPSDWTWNAAAVFCSERWERTRIRCNKHWVMLDSEENYMDELIRSAAAHLSCFTTGTCPDPEGHFFHLPKNLTIKHPLRISIGKKVHGEGMFMGWTELKPTSLELHFDPSKAKNAIETATENYSKWDHPNKFYPAIRSSVGRVAVPSRLFDSTQAVSSQPDVSLASAEELEEGEIGYGQVAKDPDVEDEDEDAQVSAAGAAGGAPQTSGVAGGQLAEELQSFGYRLVRYQYDNQVSDLVASDHIFYNYVLTNGIITAFATNENVFRTEGEGTTIATIQGEDVIDASTGESIPTAQLFEEMEEPEQAHEPFGSETRLVSQLTVTKYDAPLWPVRHGVDADHPLYGYAVHERGVDDESGFSFALTENLFRDSNDNTLADWYVEGNFIVIVEHEPTGGQIPGAVVMRIAIPH